MTIYIGIAIVTIGIGLLTYSMTFEPFTDKEEFYQKIYSVMETENNSKTFYELRDSYLTPKYNLENYGLVCMILGLYTLIFNTKKMAKF